MLSVSIPSESLNFCFPDSLSGNQSFLIFPFSLCPPPFSDPFSFRASLSLVLPLSKRIPTQTLPHPLWTCGISKEEDGNSSCIHSGPLTYLTVLPNITGPVREKLLLKIAFSDSTYESESIHKLMCWGLIITH